MSNFESKLKEKNDFIKKLFNFNGDETQFKYVKQMMKILKNDSKNFIIFFGILL